MCREPVLQCLVNSAHKLKQYLQATLTLFTPVSPAGREKKSCAQGKERKRTSRALLFSVECGIPYPISGVFIHFNRLSWWLLEVGLYHQENTT